MKRIYLSAPDVGELERDLLLDAFDSNWIAPLGPHVDAFESELAERVGVSHAVALASGTAGIDLALRLAGVTRGDRVAVSSLTFVGSVAPVVHLGAKPVFIDSEPSTWNMDPGLLEAEFKLSAKKGTLPAAAVVTDVYGQCADYARLEPLCEEYGVPLIEDAAEALGASYDGRPAGSFGVCAVFSFNGNKIVTTSGGGMIVSNDGHLVSRARHLASQARMPEVHYEHEEAGFNYRMSNLCAAVGRGQLMRLSESIERRRAIRRRYLTRLGNVPGVSFMPLASESVNYWLTVILLDPLQIPVAPSSVCRAMAEMGIEVRPAWKPMHLQPAFKTSEFVGGGVSEQIFGSGLCLPTGSGLTDDDIDRVVDSLIHTLTYGSDVGV